MASAIEKVKKERAAELFYGTSLSQAEIARKIDVSQKTICNWITKGKWERSKVLAEQMPAHVVFRLQNELVELNRAIAAREPGHRYPTLAEAETRRKIMVSINLYKKELDFAAVIQVMKNFTAYIESVNPEHMRFIINYADEYVRMEMGSLEAIPQTPFSDVDLMPFSLSSTSDTPIPPQSGSITTPHLSTLPEQKELKTD